MNKPVRMAFRTTLAVGLTLFATEIYPNAVAVRGLLCASLIAGLPTFRRAMMRQRFILMWAAAAVGMLSEVLFRDAPWFFAPFYFGLVCLVFFIGSKSRDAATMVIIAYGLSGSLLNKFPGSGNEPVFDGFFRAFWCSFGLLAGAFSFLVFPVPKPPASISVRPVSFPVRDCIYLGACAVVSLMVGVLTVEYLSSPFLVMLTLLWGITLMTQTDKSKLPIVFVLVLVAVIVALAFDTIIVASTNNLMIYMSAFLTIVWLVSWLKVSIPSLGLILTNFLVVFMLGGGMSPMPVQSFSTTLTNIYSVLSGIILATVLWVIDQTLRTAETAVEKSAQKKAAC